MIIEESKIKYLENAILIGDKVLVLGDFHLSYGKSFEEESFQKIQFFEIIKNLERIFSLLNGVGVILKQIIILGDLKHEFGRISNTEWDYGLKLLNYLDNNLDKYFCDERIIIISGNHDNLLKPIAKKKNIKIRNFYKINDICFMHGDKLFNSCLDNINTLIIGHLHPAITLKDNYKKEKYKCFLKGKWKKKVVYILPSFNPINFGFDLRFYFQKNNFKFIIDNKSLKYFKVVIYNPKEDKEYNFGKINKLIK